MTTGTRGIPRHVLLVCESFSSRLPADAVADALSAGLTAGELAPSDEIVLPDAVDGGDAATVLAAERFHERMRTARAVIIGVPALREQTLAGSVAFEAATLARQGGVPCYGVAASIELSSFDLRILDLQTVLQARGAAGLRRAGRRLAQIV